MNWLFPGFLAGAALIALPVILHFLRRRQNVIVRFPSLRFLGETAMRDTRRQSIAPLAHAAAALRGHRLDRRRLCPSFLAERHRVAPPADGGGHG